MTIRSRPGIKSPPSNLRNPQALVNWLRTNADAGVAHRRGHMDLNKEVTLTANAASTTVMDYRLSPQSGMLPTPLTLNAAAEIGNGTMFFAPTDGQCVINHANNAQADRTFTFTILG